ncbi:hypothetical protein GH714_024251 [Hevea brasiliensis]|uniref:Uncharacterized protein n=1 Tax=Hevea brasiliensis TaxID=3981 RepID=A0A6A6MPV8_HEVBR|nr:hypothetical protein GH714_024251 [Hevea brasiliensis]
MIMMNKKQLQLDSRFSYSRLSFKKRKTKGPLIADDALEDTASSPVNSPKVYDLMMMNQLNKSTKQRQNMDISSPSLQEKRRGIRVGEAKFVARNAHPGNRTPVSTVGGYYDTTTPDALCC